MSLTIRQLSVPLLIVWLDRKGQKDMANCLYKMYLGSVSGRDKYMSYTISNETLQW